MKIKKTGESVKHSHYSIINQFFNPLQQTAYYNNNKLTSIILLNMQTVFSRLKATTTNKLY